MGVLWDLLTEQGELHVDNHFVYTHGDGYVNHRFLSKPQFQRELQDLSLMLLENVIADADIDVTQPILLIGPKSLGADMVEVAADACNFQHGTNIHCAVIDYCKDTAGHKTYFWSDDNPDIEDVCLPGTQIIWMDDLMNRASTLQNTRRIFKYLCPITAVAVFFDRSGFTAADLDVPNFVWLEQHEMKAYQPYECPMCTMQLPIRTDFGHGQRFRTKHPDYPGGFVER